MNTREKEEYFGSLSNEFTGEDITIFKRYIEENNVLSENSYEMLEENLNYYNTRFSNDSFLSPGSTFVFNSNFVQSDELMKNIDYYEKSIKWYLTSVHPTDSDAVLKEEKYAYIDSLSEVQQEMIDYLNLFSPYDYHCLDILFFHQDHLYKYLPKKSFVFRWRQNCQDIERQLAAVNYFQKSLLEKNDGFWIIPIFIPIRESLFLSEYGYREALLSYGKIIERISTFFKNEEFNVEVLRKFEHHIVNEIMGVDGCEKTCLELIYVEEKK